jgi:hypothetical protein
MTRWLRALCPHHFITVPCSIRADCNRANPRRSYLLPPLLPPPPPPPAIVARPSSPSLTPNLPPSTSTSTSPRRLAHLRTLRTPRLDGACPAAGHIANAVGRRPASLTASDCQYARPARRHNPSAPHDRRPPRPFAQRAGQALDKEIPHRDRRQLQQPPLHHRRIPSRLGQDPSASVHTPCSLLLLTCRSRSTATSSTPSPTASATHIAPKASMDSGAVRPLVRVSLFASLCSPTDGLFLRRHLVPARQHHPRAHRLFLHLPALQICHR